MKTNSFIASLNVSGTPGNKQEGTMFICSQMMKLAVITVVPKQEAEKKRK